MDLEKHLTNLQIFLTTKMPYCLKNMETLSQEEIIEYLADLLSLTHR